MADICEAAAESAKLLRSLAAQDSAHLTTIWIGPEKRLPDAGEVDVQPVKGPSVHDLATRLEGAAMEMKRLRGEVARYEAMAAVR